MRKEKIVLGAIKQDLLKIVKFQLLNKSNWRFSYIVPITLLAVTVGTLLKNVFVGLLVFSVAAYHIVRYVIEYRKCKKSKNAIISIIGRGEISVSTETLRHIAREIIYEPHNGWGNFLLSSVFAKTHLTKTVTVYHFNGEASWRVPTVDKHYSWSREFYMSSKGLENISIVGDEFFFVRLQNHPDIAYIYPCKNFELDESLET